MILAAQHQDGNLSIQTCGKPTTVKLAGIGAKTADAGIGENAGSTHQVDALTVGRETVGREEKRDQMECP